MESFQQKVPPISLRAFEDKCIFDWKVEETTGSQYPPFSFLGEGSVLRHILTINVTRFNTHLHKHGWRNFGREIDLFREWRHILTSFYRSEEEPRHSFSLWGNIDRISIINTKNPPTIDSVGLSLGNCPQHCKQDLSKKINIAAHVVIFFLKSRNFLRLIVQSN
jgi:hypothetical protein